MRYALARWAFQWKQDEDGDLAFVLLNRIAFVKYKESTIIRFDGHRMKEAPRYIRIDKPCKEPS